MYYILGLISTGIGGRYDILVYIFFFVILIYMILKKKIIIPKGINFFILIAFCIIFMVISSFKQEVTIFLLIGPIIMYYSGIIIIKTCKENNKDDYIIKCIFAILVGLFIHAMLNFSINIGSERRNTTDFWTGEIMSATLQGTLLTPMLSLFFFTIMFIKDKKAKTIMIICFVLALAYDMIIATRSVIIIAFITFIISLISYIIMENTIKNKFRIVSIIFMIFIIGIIMYNNNAFNIKSIIEESNLYSRVGKNETEESDFSRLNAQIEGLKQIVEYPFGVPEDTTVAGMKYAHNMWIDIARQVGIIPFLLLILFFLFNIKSLIKIIINQKVTLKLKILLISEYVTFLFMFYIEPILQGIPVVFILFCLIMGFVDSLAEICEKNERIIPYTSI